MKTINFSPPLQYECPTQHVSQLVNHVHVSCAVFRFYCLDFFLVSAVISRSSMLTYQIVFFVSLVLHYNFCSVSTKGLYSFNLLKTFFLFFSQAAVVKKTTKAVTEDDDTYFQYNVENIPIHWDHWMQSKSFIPIPADRSNFSVELPFSFNFYAHPRSLFSQ